jgi:hypothetical protein
MQLLKKDQSEPTFENLEIHKEIESRQSRSASMEKRQHCCSPADVFRTLLSNLKETLRKDRNEKVETKKKNVQLRLFHPKEWRCNER